MSDLPNGAAVAHYVIHGAFTFPYANDARSAVARFPEEWSHEPWSQAASSREIESLIPAPNPEGN